MAAIEIAVPAYNCEPWLDAFFESVIAQDFTDWRIVARDDASKDGTASRLAWWQQKLGPRMLMVEDSGKRNLGMVGNYNAVLAATSAPWVMFADPDDVWKPGKIARTVGAMQETESSHYPSTPVLVCSDAEVVDHELRAICGSYWQWSRMNPDLVGVLHRMVVESPVLTSTMMVNRALLNLAMPLTGAASCPDWWPGMVASAFGRVVRLRESTILYRRHPSNDSLDPFGATLIGAVRRFLADIGAPRRRVERLVRQWAPQAQAFADRFRDRLGREDIAALEAAARMPEAGAVVRRWKVIRHGLWFASPVKNAGLMLLM